MYSVSAVLLAWVTWGKVNKTSHRAPGKRFGFILAFDLRIRPDSNLENLGFVLALILTAGKPHSHDIYHAALP